MSLPPAPDLTERKKFAFDNDFFDVTVAPPGHGGGAPIVAAAQGSSAEKREKAAREDGYAAGLAEGRAQATQAATQELAVLKNTLFDLTQKLEHAQTIWENTQQQQALSLLRLSLHHLIGHAAQHYPDQLLEHFLHGVLPLLRTGEELTLRLHPQARAYHEKLGLPQASIGGRPFQIQPDSSLGPADVVVEWRGGGLEARLADVLARLDTLLAGTGADTTLPVPPLPTTAIPVAPVSRRPDDLPRAAPSEPVAVQGSDPLAALAAAQKQRADALLDDA